jgi:RNA polymerase sigma-70 factor (ECF subfamily)
MNAGDIDDRSRRRAWLMAAAQRGDATSYAELLNDLGPMVMRFLRRRVRDPEERQDLYQEIFLALHRARHTYEAERPLEPWLLAIARRIVADRDQRGRVRRSHEVPLEVPETGTAGDADARVQLAQAMRTLSPAQQEAVVLLRVEGLPLEVAARRAGTTTGALKVRAHRAYRTLCRLLLVT